MPGWLTRPEDMEKAINALYFFYKIILRSENVIIWLQHVPLVSVEIIVFACASVRQMRHIVVSVQEHIHFIARSLQPINDIFIDGS